MIATYHLDEIWVLGSAIKRVEICFELMIDVVVA